MKWVLFVVLMNPSGDLEKIMNGGMGWENRSDCRTVIETIHEDITSSVKQYYSEFTVDTQIIGVGCYQPLTNQEDIVVIYD